MSDFSFSKLTPDMILDALEGIDIWPDSGLLALNSYENRVYQFAADGRRYVVKFYRPERWSDAQIEEEHHFTQALLDAEIPVVAPLALGSESRTLHHFQGYRFCVFPSVGGRALEADQDEHLFQLGRQIGRLHMVGKATPFLHRPTLVSDAQLSDAMTTLQQCELIPSAMRLPFDTILQHVYQRLQSVDWQLGQSIRLHGDCHVGNLLWRDEQLTLVDLDDCRQGPAIQDLWMMLSGDRSAQLMQLDTLIDGYEEFAEFNPAELKLIEPLRAWRIIQYMAWLAKRWSDPAFPRNFSWFAEESYWERQVLALKEQLAALDDEPLRLQSGY
ncbi:serine/threonine protein kinase [Aliidiomarina maris]|uniref:Stress response kinase A n=1 Tax=Aliidiomarina maris TaxID=531312 RepID=A0A327WR77_9GAMM|nr:serine/threonine protein kinase [Aliidiomarina maris]MCL5049881.1 serine/threonine protein kinase [Bacillota bacterium]RAJ93587.1 Ser/Thr protein kinase RdoA (MazF antagonist) [Aliidiomarina maris]RUO18781.1 serine/threonine protein kinase [Aliidiomarina maris]